MPDYTIDAASANESPSTSPASAETTPAVTVNAAVAKAARKPAKRSAAPKSAKESAEAAVEAPAKPAKPVKQAKVAASASVVKPPKAIKAAPTAPAAPAKPVKVAKPAKPVQPEVLPALVPTQPKPRLVRDSFTIPELEYAQLEALKRRALALAHHVKKSELLRAGIATMAAMDDVQLMAALQAVPSLKTGRPKKPKADKAVIKTRNGGKKS